jgi:hypothetical protein
MTSPKIEMSVNAQTCLEFLARSPTRLRRFFGLKQAQNWKDFEAAQGERPLLFSGENYSITEHDVS